jgi:hypothetical protein
MKSTTNATCKDNDRLFPTSSLAEASDVLIEEEISSVVQDHVKVAHEVSNAFMDMRKTGSSTTTTTLLLTESTQHLNFCKIRKIRY